MSFAVAWDLMFGIAFATRDGIAGTLHCTSTVLNSHFTVANTVVNGINKKPGQFTGGEGPATGQEVLISVTFNQRSSLTPITISSAPRCS